MPDQKPTLEYGEPEPSDPWKRNLLILIAVVIAAYAAFMWYIRNGT
jgi:hypothetical protein